MYKQKSLNISEYFHVLNKSETQLLFQSLEDIFYQIFEFEIDDKKVRRRFSMVTENKDRESSLDRKDNNANKDEGYENTLARVLTGRQKKNKKYQDDYNSSFISNPGSPGREPKSDTLGVGLHRTAANYMMTNSLLEASKQDDGDKNDDDDEGQGSGRKSCID